MNNDIRIRIRDTSDTEYKLCVCIDYDPNNIINTGISTTPEEAIEGKYLDYADTINAIIVANSKDRTAHSYEYIASNSRIDANNHTVTIIGLSSSGGTGHDTNIYQVTGKITGNGVLTLRLRGDYSGKSLQSAKDAFNSGDIPPYMQPMVSMYNYRYAAYKEITSWNNFMSTEPWKDEISTLIWLRCLDISYINDISSLAKEATSITTDDGLDAFVEHPLIDMESIFAFCDSIQSVTHMNNYILTRSTATDVIKSMFYACSNLTYLKLTGWEISTEVPYLSMFMAGSYGKDFMCDPNKEYTLIVDGTMRTVMMGFGGGTDTTEGIIRDLLSDATPDDNDIYTITRNVLQSD
jgi:hypothetical protein